MKKLFIIMFCLLSLWVLFITFAQMGMDIFRKDAIKTGAFTYDGKTYRVTVVRWSEYDNAYKRAD